jgi:hypothetical protein
MKTFFRKVLDFYLDGFRNMSASNRKLWVIIIIKLVIIFFVLKLFFFPDYLDSKFNTDKEKSDHVIEQLITH